MVVGEIEIGTDILIIGSGPAGYTAAIRCGQLGLDVTMAGPQLGGVCMNLGCIPYKALMHSVDLTLEARESSLFGVDEQATLDMTRAQAWKDKVVSRLGNGLSRLLEASGVEVIDGLCSFESSSTAIVKSARGSQRIMFHRAVIATGSHFKTPEGVNPDGNRFITPYSLAHMASVPRSAVVLGGGIGSATTVSLLAKMGVEVSLAFKGKSLIGAVDDDVIQPAMSWLQGHGVKVYPSASWELTTDGPVKISSEGKVVEVMPEKVIFVTSQEANTASLNLAATGVKLNEKGSVTVDGNYRTADSSIYAIGDVLGGSRNASTAFREGSSIANVLAGKPGLPEYRAVPMTIYTEPPIACAGMNESQAKKAGIDVVIGKSPYAANGAAVLSGDDEGFVKVIAEKSSGRIMGVEIVGKNATNLLGEGLLAIEMGARLEDIALTLHPHPELCEVFYDACARGAGLSSNATPGR